jgi:TrmH family RNA methyltransferase
MVITSTSNSQVKELALLQKKAKERSAQDVFVVEGIKMFREVPPDRLVGTYVSESFFHKNESLFPDLTQVILLSDRVFESVSDTKTPQGILCLVRQYHYGLSDLMGERPLIMALENLQDPGNLGTIVRTAEGAGVTGILMSRGCVDIYNSKVIRSTMGSIYRMPFYYTDHWSEELQLLKTQGVSLYAAHLKGEGYHDRQDYTRPTAFLIGNESRGLTDETAALADTYIRIPMCGHVESLNAAVASSILMYEANRQRRS